MAAALRVRVLRYIRGFAANTILDAGHTYHASAAMVEELYDVRPTPTPRFRTTAYGRRVDVLRHLRLVWTYHGTGRLGSRSC